MDNIIHFLLRLLGRILYRLLKHLSLGGALNRATELAEEGLPQRVFLDVDDLLLINFLSLLNFRTIFIISGDLWTLLVASAGADRQDELFFGTLDFEDR